MRAAAPSPRRDPPFGKGSRLRWDSFPSPAEEKRREIFSGSQVCLTGQVTRNLARIQKLEKEPPSLRRQRILRFFKGECRPNVPAHSSAYCPVTKTNEHP